MNLPKTIRIAGQIVKITKDNLSDDNLFGYYSHDRKTIFLSEALQEKEILTTLRHELMEASLCISGVGWCETYEQEAVVRCMDEVFFPAYERLLKRLK